MNHATSTLEHVTSADGTRIGFDRLGEGPPIVLLPGGSTDRGSNNGLAALLAADFTVLNVDRRGRGDSGDTLPYAVQREIDDIEAVVDAAGGSAALYGSSSGAALAMLAAAQLGDKVTGLVLWEVPYFIDEAARPPADHVEQYDQMLAEGRRADAVEYFMSKIVRLPPEFVAFAKTQPFFAASEKIAHTLPYDGRVMGDYHPPLDIAERVTAPTLALAGGASFPFMRETAELLANTIPNGRTELLEGQEHNVDPAALAPAIKRFLAT